MHIFVHTCTYSAYRLYHIPKFLSSSLQNLYHSPKLARHQISHPQALDTSSPRHEQLGATLQDKPDLSWNFILPFLLNLLNREDGLGERLVNRFAGHADITTRGQPGTM